jgi:predicted RNA-binding Zn-ribbon protein involved in translation (DUF1610 family)
MDYSSVAGAYEALKATKELLTFAFNAKVDAEAKAKILEAQKHLGEIQDTLFNVREQLFALQGERDELKQRLEQTLSWQRRIEDYELVKTAGEAVVLQSKSDPKHYACPSCVNKNELHILQTNRTFSGKYRCTGCGSEFPVEARMEANISLRRTTHHWSGA